MRKLKTTVILQNTIHPQDVKKLDGVEHSYMIGSDVAVIGFDDGSERYYTNYRIIITKKEL